MRWGRLLQEPLHLPGMYWSEGVNFTKLQYQMYQEWMHKWDLTQNHRNFTLLGKHLPKIGDPVVARRFGLGRAR